LSNFRSKSENITSDLPGALGKRSYIPDGSTPGKGKPKRGRDYKGKGAKKTLFLVETDVAIKEKKQSTMWTDPEIIALVQYICLYWDDAYTNEWPFFKNPIFWNECAASVNKVCNASRTGTVNIFVIV
jgi:hypothetical protein